MRSSTRTGISFPSLATLFVATLGLTTGRATSQQDPQAVRYGRDVRPILSDRCFSCHGPDAHKREADLRLDVRDAAIATRDGGAAIVPGDPAASELLRRIACADPDEVMPPPKSGKRAIGAEEQALLTRWIEQGAPYEEHWSFAPPRKTEVAGSIHPVDWFVDRALAAHGLPRGKSTDRETLARRLFLTVTGLPPTPEELAAFVADDRPDAYDRLVDKLFDEEPYRTRHAEHLATPWLDAARYADTSGIHMDAGRQIWPYRDWLIEALRNDKPFDEFVVEQVAGDLLPDATAAQRVATGFLRSHVTTDEGGAIDEEYRIEYASERTSTLGTVFLGMTVGCARCHDHKYDPITQEDFYKLLAFFDKNEEPGLYSQQPNPNRALEPAMAVPSDEQRAREGELQAALTAAKAALAQEVPAEAAERTAFFAGLQQQAGLDWRSPMPNSAASRDGATLTVQPDGSVLASGANPPQDQHVITLPGIGADNRLLFVEALPDASLPLGKVGRAPNGNVVMSHVHLEVRDTADAAWRTVELVWAVADIEQGDGDYFAINVLDPDQRGWAIDAHRHDAGPRRLLLLADQAFAGEARVTLTYDSVYAQHTFGRVRLACSPLADAMAARLPIARGGFYVAGPFPGKDREALYACEHGPGQATRLDLGAKWGKQGWRFVEDLREGMPYTKLAQGSNVHYVAQRVYAPTARKVGVSLGSDDGFVAFVDGARVTERKVDRGVAADQDAIEVEHRAGEGVFTVAVVNTGGVGGVYVRRPASANELPGGAWQALLPTSTQDATLTAALHTSWRENFSPDYRARREAIAKLEADRTALAATIPQTMVMREAANRRQTYVLLRGEYDKPDKNRPVEPELPAMFGSLPLDAPKNRLGLARWLVSADNPLLLRVAANRLWEFVFGAGIVRTSEDFGLQGEWPSHPELLDWLAVELRENGFSQRRLLKLLVRSDAFLRGSAVEPVALERDADNRFLSRYPRRRLGAEALRDQALYVSGLLVERVGGPSVKPYQPPGLWREVAMLQSNTRTFVRGDGDDLYRRSLYTYWKRACPPPTLLTLDAPTREFCSVRRVGTNTPLQALALWNDEQFVEAARGLAQRTLAQPGNLDDRLRTMYRRCTGHELDAAGLTASRTTYERLRARFAAGPDDAKALLGVGELPRPDEAEPAELAALTVVANAFLNLDTCLYVD